MPATEKDEVLKMHIFFLTEVFFGGSFGREYDG